MQHESDMPTMISALRHLMAGDDGNRDFSPPSLLKEVPSLTLPYSAAPKDLSEYGQLGRSAG
jgi:hypothetical protein